MSSGKSQVARRFTAVAALLILGGGLWRWWAPEEPRREARLNFLLVTVDTLRADAVGAYGRAGNPTPWIDRLADGGVRFTNAYAHNVVTLPSHANILTGRLPPIHGVRDNAGFRLPADVDTLARALGRTGYRTAAFVSAFPLDSRFGLDSGFEVYDDGLAGGLPRPAFLFQERRATETVAAAVKWIESAESGPWFCWVHVYEPHYPYEPPEPFRARWPADPYVGEVGAADAALAPLLAPILDEGGTARTLVVLTSDHGESLGEHGEATHGIFAYESALRVPLVMYAPRILRRAVVDAVAQHVDILPTVLDALALPAPGSDGRTLLPVIADANEAEDPAVYFEALSGSLNRGWAPLYGIIRHRFKYIDLPIPELYDLRSDPREERNLVLEDPGRVRDMHAELLRIRPPTAIARVEESADVQQRLRSLGYTSGRPPPRETYTEEDDPKRLIALDTILQETIARYLAGDLDGALKRARDLVTRRPSMAVAWMQLAHLEREVGNLSAAVDAMQRAAGLQGQEEDHQTFTLLGAYLTEAGRAAEAVKLLEPEALGADADVDLLAAYALALTRIERIDDALAVLARARRQDPDNAMLLVHQGTVQLTGGDRAAARASFAEALQVDPKLARAHSSLGVMAVEDGRVEEAFEHWRTAGALDSSEYGRILRMGLAFAREKRGPVSRACLEFFAANAPRAEYAADLDRVHAWLTANRAR